VKLAAPAGAALASMSAKASAGVPVRRAEPLPLHRCTLMAMSVSPIVDRRNDV
jgi:hypothetical protein